MVQLRTSRPRHGAPALAFRAPSRPRCPPVGTRGTYPGAGRPLGGRLRQVGRYACRGRGAHGLVAHHVSRERGGLEGRRVGGPCPPQGDQGGPWGEARQPGVGNVS